MNAERTGGAAAPQALEAALPWLRCPLCHRPLTTEESVVRCGAGHSFDRARQGYVSLLPGDAQTATADDARMVQARERFLAGGFQDALAARIAALSASAVPAGAPAGVPGCVVDAGAGTGFVLARVLTGLPGRTGIAVDLSKHALRRAARAHPRMAAVAADTWRGLPVRDGAADLVLCVFAPRNAEEFARVLAPGGALVVVTPTDRHLAEAVRALGLLSVDPRKPARLSEQLEPFFAPVEQVTHEERWRLGSEHLEALAAMGPSARHLDPDDLRRRVAALPQPLEVRCAVTVSLLRPTSP